LAYFSSTRAWIGPTPSLGGTGGVLKVYPDHPIGSAYEPFDGRNHYAYSLEGSLSGAGRTEAFTDDLVKPIGIVAEFDGVECALMIKSDVTLSYKWAASK